MTLNDLMQTNETGSAPSGDLVSVMPTGGLGQILSSDEIKEKIVVTDHADESATMTSNAIVAEAMETLDIGLTGFEVELMQLKQRGEEARENGEDIAQLAQDFNPNSDAEIAKRNEEYIPGMPSSTITSESYKSNEIVSENVSHNDVEPDDDYEAAGTFDDGDYVPNDESTTTDSVNTNFEIDDNDFDDVELSEDDDMEDDASEDDATFEARKNEYINKVKELVVPIQDVVDLTSMSISTKKISGSKAASFTNVPATSASHPLLTTGRLVTMTSLDANEVASFNPDVLNRLRELCNKNYRGTARDAAYTLSSFSYYISLLETIYNHIISPKASTFKEWMKTTYIADIDDLIFAAYKATYGQVGNILSFECDECHNAWPEVKDIEDMISFESDDPKWKERYIKILKSNPDASMPPEMELVQISSNYAVKMGAPTLEKIAEIAALDMDFANKYIDLISISQYIYEIYFIDREANTLVPVVHKTYPDDVRKTAKSRLYTIGNIIQKSLTNDQRQILTAKTDDYDRPSSAIRYIYPEATCPKCGAKIEKMYADPSSLLFTRYQLVTLIN